MRDAGGRRIYPMPHQYPPRVLASIRAQAAPPTPPPAKTLEEKLTAKIGNRATVVVRRQSGGRVYSFFWYVRASRLAVKVTRVPRDRDVEALAAKLGALWNCPGCSKV